MIRSLLLAHGAGSGPWVFAGWNEAFRGLLPRPLAALGWSMGGLVVLAAAPLLQPERFVLIEASPPVEVQGGDESIVPRDGVFDPEKVYGRFPDGIAARLESQRARDERGELLARYYGSKLRRFPGLDHWQLILRPEVRAAVGSWLRG